jgi:helicase
MPDMSQVIRTLSVRVHHGVKPELLPLVALHNIGRVRARSLFNAGYPDPEAVARAGLQKISRIIGEGIARQLLGEITGGKRSGLSRADENLHERKPELLTDIPGIGKKMAEKLQDAGILSISDLLTADEMLLMDILGSARTRKVLAFLAEAEETDPGPDDTDSVPETPKITGQSSWEDFGC